MTPLDSLTAQLACSFCRNEIGRLVCDGRLVHCFEGEPL